MPELGKKFTCSECGAKFYDLGRPDPVCPSCGVNQREELERKAAAEAAAEAEAAKAKAESEAEEKEIENDDEEEELFDDDLDT